MAYTTIDKPTDYFNTVLYTGNGSTGHAITGVGFQPDLVWLKCRPQARNHRWIDVIRGVGKHLESDNNDAEESPADGLTAFGSDGFTVGNTGGYNNSSENFVSWNWLASNTTASNTDGSITSTVSANTTAGFSIVSYTGTGSAATVGHGLGVAPSLYIVKNRDSAAAWRVFVSSLGADKILRLSTTHASSTDTSMWNNTSPTSSVFSIGTPAQVNTSGENYIAYCFAEKKGYSKIGSYTGNGSTDGTFIYTGFKPAFFLLKKSSATDPWVIFDNKRAPHNYFDKLIYPDSSEAESGAAERGDFLSNGVKFRSNHTYFNGSGITYIFMAFAENPFVTSTGIPTTAR